MSQIIRSVRSSWLAPPPVNSNDVSIEMPKNTYRLAQIAIEATERAQQSQINRMIRAGRQNAMPGSISATPLRMGPMPTVTTVPLVRGYT